MRSARNTERASRVHPPRPPHTKRASTILAYHGTPISASKWGEEGCFRQRCFPGKVNPFISQAQANKNVITLKGSAQIVTEFFGYSINRYLE